MLSQSNSMEQAPNALDHFDNEKIVKETSDQLASLTRKEEGGGERGPIEGMLVAEEPLPGAPRPQTRGRSSGPSARNTRG